MTRNLLAFAKDGDAVLTMPQLAGRYRIDFAGTNYYYGLAKVNADRLANEGTPFAPWHKAFLDALLDALVTGPKSELTLVLGLQPPKEHDGFANPYDAVDARMQLVSRLAEGLAGYQNQASEQGRQLNLVVRYASEMNAPENPYGGHKADFRRSFVDVRDAFRARAEARFAFSPAIRADIDGLSDADYWPGDAVDLIGGTWYVGADAQFTASKAHLKAHLQRWKNKGKPFGIDELGGGEPKPVGGKHQNDRHLQRMFEVLRDEEASDPRFQMEYVTIFLEKVWGTDATLAFLRDSTP